MFILNVPLQTNAAKLNLLTPTQNAQQSQFHRVEIDLAGNVSWGGTQIDQANLEAKFAAIGRIKDVAAQPEIHFCPDKYAHYDMVQKVMALAQKLYVQQIDFVGNVDAELQVN